MKKILLSLLVLATTNVFAQTYSAKATLTLKSNDGKICEIVIAQSDELNEGYNNGYCGEMNMSEREVALYAIVGDVKYQTWGTKTLGELPFGIKTNSSVSYDIEVSSVSGVESLYLKDLLNDSIILLTNGAKYSFVTNANTTIDTRFKLCKPAEPTICHQYGNLIITGHKGAKVKVLDMAGEIAIAEQTLATDDEVISLSALTKGTLYQVVLGEDTMIIRVQ